MEAPEKDKANQYEYRLNDKWATYSGAKGQSQFPHTLCSCAIFWNAIILLNPSIAKEILGVKGATPRVWQVGGWVDPSSRKRRHNRHQTVTYE